MGLGSFNRELTRNSVVLIPIAMHGFVYLFLTGAAMALPSVFVVTNAAPVGAR